MPVDSNLLPSCYQREVHGRNTYQPKRELVSIKSIEALNFFVVYRALIIEIL